MTRTHIMTVRQRVFVAAFPVLLLLGSSPAALAHCDTLDGPVVAAARQALDQGNANLVLIWVSKSNEPEVRTAFDKALTVRETSPAAKDMADNYFFETLVRVHRLGEGAPYNGLKPAGADLGPAVPAADKAITTGNVDPVTTLLTETLQSGLREQFSRVQARKNYNKDDVEAGREYVGAYVEYVHYVERLYEAAKEGAHGHYAESTPAASPTTACAAH